MEFVTLNRYKEWWQVKRRRIAFVAISMTLITLMSGCGTPIQRTTPQSASSTQESNTSADTGKPAEDTTPKLLFELTTAQGEVISFELNNSSAAKSFYEQLPLSLDIEDYGEYEKIFYPPEKLDTSDTPLAKGPVGTVAYYAPWGNVAIYSGDCGGASGLYQLGQVVSGSEYISQLSGVVQFKATSDNTGEK